MISAKVLCFHLLSYNTRDDYYSGWSYEFLFKH